MSLSNPTATALLRFFERLASGQDKSLGSTIAECFGLSEHSFEFYSLLLSQSRNFLILRRQIELSDIRALAKGAYSRQLNALANVIRYDSLPARFHELKRQHIDPNIIVLSYLEDTIRTAPELSVEAIEELNGLADKFQDLRSEISGSSLPLYVRSELEQQLDELIFALRHFEYIGADTAWKQASVVTATIIKEAPVAQDPATQSLFGKLVSVLALLAAAVATTDSTLGHLGSIVERSGKLLGQFKAGYELIERWKPKPPLIEYRPNKGDTTEV